VTEPTSPQPVLVYDRVATNRRATRRLLTLFTLLTVPFVAGLVPLLAPAIYFGVLEPTLGKSVLARFHTSGEGAVLTVAVTVTLAVLVVLGSSIAVAGLEVWQATRLVLRLTGARPIGREAEPELARAVENLSLAAGLPPPKTYVIESRDANAFAVGLDPARSAVVVTRGLLQLLDRRGLQGVIAHELSHVGNQDTRLNTLLAGVLAVLRLPLTILRMGRAFRNPLVLKLFGGHLCARRVGGALSQRREFLADADAVLLTRDPEGLALALVQVGAASGAPMNLSRATAHLFFVEPLAPETGWWDRGAMTHPSIEARVTALGQMGSGISPDAVAKAREAGERFRAQRGEATCSSGR
jgi:heat shock protein HtpX